MQTYSAFDEDFVHNGLLHEKIAVEEKHVEKKYLIRFFLFFSFGWLPLEMSQPMIISLHTES